MSKSLTVPRGVPPQLLGFNVGPAIHAADLASDMAQPFGHYLPNGWKVERSAKSALRAYVAVGRAAPYIDVLSSFDSPAQQLADELTLLRGTVEADLLAQNRGRTPHEAAASVTPSQVAHSVGSVLGRRLFAPEGQPDTLPAPLLRGLAEVYAKQKLGAKATAADLVRDKIPSNTVLKAAAPEILIALGFDPAHPMVQSADRGGLVRGMGRLLMPGKFQALTFMPSLARHIQAMLPPRGEDLRLSFGEVQRFMGALVVPKAGAR